MRVIKTGLLNQNKIRVFDSTKELNITRDHELQRLALQDVGIGSDMDAVGRHFSELYKLLRSDRKEDAIQETINLNNNIYCMIEKINIKSLCFVTMIESINGEKVDDFSDDKVREVIDKLSTLGVKQSEVEDIVEDVKKKLRQNFDPVLVMMATRDLETSL